MKNWLTDGNNQYNIGGRDTDIAQIGYSIKTIIKEYYPINGVPKEVVIKINQLCSILEIGEQLLEEFILYMNNQK